MFFNNPISDEAVVMREALLLLDVDEIKLRSELSARESVSVTSDAKLSRV